MDARGNKLSPCQYIEKLLHRNLTTLAKEKKIANTRVFDNTKKERKQALG